MLTDVLRTALSEAETDFSTTYEEELAQLESAESWQKIEQDDRNRILKESHVRKISKGKTGTEQEVLQSLEKCSLDAWRDRTAALPQLFVNARIKADRFLDPETSQVKLNRATLRTPEDVVNWLDQTEQILLEKIEQGPIVVG